MQGLSLRRAGGHAAPNALPASPPDGRGDNDQPFTAPAATPLMMCFWQVR